MIFIQDNVSITKDGRVKWDCPTHTKLYTPRYGDVVSVNEKCLNEILGNKTMNEMYNIKYKTVCNDRSVLQFKARDDFSDLDTSKSCLNLELAGSVELTDEEITLLAEEMNKCFSKEKCSINEPFNAEKLMEFVEAVKNGNEA